jgi:hypothetical protein
VYCDNNDQSNIARIGQNHQRKLAQRTENTRAYEKDEDPNYKGKEENEDRSADDIISKG